MLKTVTHLHPVLPLLPKPHSFILIGSICLFLTSCGTTERFGDRRAASGKAIEKGVASWYGPNFHGKLTANGEVYNMYALTAAHRTLPFNTMVKVKSLDNGKSVIVRINDRGPFAKNRIIDLSKKAASEIGMLGPGTANVSLYIVSGDLAAVHNRDLKTATYTIQLGSFAEESRAINKARQIRGARVEKVYLNGGQSAYRVYYGVYTKKDKAEKDRKRLSRNGFDGYIKQLEN